MLNETTAPRLLETTNRAFELIKNKHSDCEIGSIDDLRDYRVKVIFDRSKKQLVDLKMDFRLQQQNQELDEIRLLNLEYQSTIKRVVSKNRQIQKENQELRAEAQESKKSLKRVLDSNDNVDRNANIKRVPNGEYTKPADSKEKRDELVETLRARNASLLEEKDELIRKGDRFKNAYSEFKRSYEDLRTNYEEVRAEKKAELMKDPRITKLINSEKDAEIKALKLQNAMLGEELSMLKEKMQSHAETVVKKERDTFDQGQPSQHHASASREAEKQKVKEMESKTKKLEECKAFLENHLRTKEAEIKVLQNKFTQNQQNRDKLQTEGQADKSRIGDLEKECKALKDRHEMQLKSATEQLEKEQQNSDKLKQDLANERDELRNQNELFVRLKKEHEGQISALKSELEKKQQKTGESGKASEDLNRLKADLANKDLELKKYKTLYEKAEHDIKRKLELINDLTRANQECQTKYNLSSDVIDLLKEKLATTEQILASKEILCAAAPLACASAPLACASHSPSPGMQQQQHLGGYTPINRIATQPGLMNTGLRHSPNSPLIPQQRISVSQQRDIQQQQQNMMQQQQNMIQQHQQQQKMSSMIQSAFLQQQQQQQHLQAVKSFSTQFQAANSKIEKSASPLHDQEKK